MLHLTLDFALERKMPLELSTVVSREMPMPGERKRAEFACFLSFSPTDNFSCAQKRCCLCSRPPLFRSYLEQLDQFLDLPVFGGKVHVALGPEIWLLLIFLALGGALAEVLLRLTVHRNIREEYRVQYIIIMDDNEAGGS